MKYKKTIIISVILLAISFILIALFNSSYALFSSDDYGSNTNSYSTGLLSIKAVSKTENISLANTLPIPDEEGIDSIPYVFTIKNDGNLDYKFNVKLLSVGDSENIFSSQYIKLQIDDGEVTSLNGFSNGIIKKDITLLAGESIDISIKVWLSIDTPNTELGKSFNSKIVIDGQAVYTSTNNMAETKFAEYITNLYVDSYKKEVINNKIIYNYATSVNLMNDRLGGTTESLDGGNIRYYGSSPNNYLYFNCNDYDNQTSSTCELWRIIGVIDDKVKIIREKSLGSLAWDYDEENGNVNATTSNWSVASLNNLLNHYYYNNSDNVLYYGNKNVASSSSAITLNFASNNIGIKNDKTRNMISSSTWYLGGHSKNDVYSDQIYKYERDSSRTISGEHWNGNIALASASDYGYSVDFQLITGDLSSDIAYTWMELLNRSESLSTWWLLNFRTGQSNHVWAVTNTGGISYWDRVYYSRHVNPTLYLDNYVNVVAGSGSSTDPYRLG